MSKSTEMVAVEVWVMVDEDGDWVAEPTAGELKARYEQDVCELDGSKATRLVKITVNIPKPRAVELVATVAEEAEAGELRVA